LDRTGEAFESTNVSFNGQKTENGTLHRGYNGAGGNLSPVKKDKLFRGKGGGGYLILVIPETLNSPSPYSA